MSRWKRPPLYVGSDRPLETNGISSRNALPRVLNRATIGPWLYFRNGAFKAGLNDAETRVIGDYLRAGVQQDLARSRNGFANVPPELAFARVAELSAAETRSRWKSIRALVIGMVGVCALAGAPLAAAQDTSPHSDVRLYTLDCGRIDFEDLKGFSDTGEHDGEKEVMPVSCFLIRHGGEWMLWDAGLGDEIAADPAGRVVVGLHFRVPRTLVSQLAKLGLKPDDIRLVGLSHVHADHRGNVALFPHATFLVSPKELEWASGPQTPDGVRSDVVAALRRSRIRPAPADMDVFGDGTVRLISTPGHTPGHHSLLVRLRHTGPVLLSGDVAHFQRNYDEGLVPLGNVSRAETLASIARVKGLVAHYRAKLVIQHAVGVFDSLPKPPSYLD